MCKSVPPCSDDSYVIRRMQRDEVPIALDWAAAEGWTPGLDDARAFYAADPGGFLVGELDGVPIATISAVRYGDGLGFIGFYIVAPPWRGRGYGLRLWNAAMAELGTERNVGLDGVLAQQDNYRKSGFQLAYSNTRYQGVGESSPVALGIVELATIPVDEIADYDAAVFTVARPSFLREWVRQPGGAALGAIKDGRLAGYGVVRPCRLGYKIGPLFADDEATAESLFNALVSGYPGEPVFLDTPEANPDGVALARRHGMAPVFQTARMYTRTPPPAPLHKVYGVTSFELG